MKTILNPIEQKTLTGRLMRNTIRLRNDSEGWRFFNPTTKTWVACSRLDAHKMLRNVMGY